MSNWNLDKQKNNDFKIIVMTVIIVFLLVVLFSGCNNNKTVCKDGYMYDKNEYGYKVKDFKKC